MIFASTMLIGEGQDEGDEGPPLAAGEALASSLPLPPAPTPVRRARSQSEHFLNATVAAAAQAGLEDAPQTDGGTVTSAGFMVDDEEMILNGQLLCHHDAPKLHHWHDGLPALAIMMTVTQHASHVLTGTGTCTLFTYTVHWRVRP